MSMNDKAYLKGMKMAVDRLESVTRFQEYSEGCPTCRRPFRTLESHERARSGNPGSLEHEAAKELKDASKNCKKVYDFLRWELHMAMTRSHRAGYTSNDGWCCAEDFREFLGKGDWPRRVRQLSEEYGVAVERKMDVPKGGQRKVAFYRLSETHFDYENQEYEYV